MKNRTLLGAATILLIIAGIFFYAATKTTPKEALETSENAFGLSGTSFVEHAEYYDIAVNYASSTPLSGVKNTEAVSLMKQFASETIAQFKKEGNFTNLTEKDIEMMGFGDGRKESLDIVYMTALSPRTVSYIFTTYANTLGAHPNTYFRTFTFNTSSGAHLSLTDLFTPETDYLSKLSQISRMELPRVIGDLFDTDSINAGTEPNEENFRRFFLDNQSLVILFDPYQVAAYAAGPQTLRIPLSELTSILKPEYR